MRVTWARSKLSGSSPSGPSSERARRIGAPRCRAEKRAKLLGVGPRKTVTLNGAKVFVFHGNVEPENDLERKTWCSFQEAGYVVSGCMCIFFRGVCSFGRVLDRGPHALVGSAIIHSIIHAREVRRIQIAAGTFIILGLFFHQQSYPSHPGLQGLQGLQLLYKSCFWEETLCCCFWGLVRLMRLVGDW